MLTVSMPSNFTLVGWKPAFVTINDMSDVGTCTTNRPVASLLLVSFVPTTVIVAPGIGNSLVGAFSWTRPDTVMPAGAGGEPSPGATVGEANDGELQALSNPPHVKANKLGRIDIAGSSARAKPGVNTCVTVGFKTGPRHDDLSKPFPL